MSAEDLALRANVYEMHAEKLRQRYASSCNSLDTLSDDASSSASGHPPAHLHFRAPGSKAGSHPHKPWHHSAFRDAYERICVWSHAFPGLLFFLAAAFVNSWAASVAKPMAFFCVAAGLTHTLSAIGHVYPDSHSLEKADHLGIVALIIGDPLSSLMAIEHGHVPLPMYVIGALLLAGAFLPPAPRVAAFATGIIAIVGVHGKEMYTTNLGVQLALFSIGGVTFLRNAGHNRFIGGSDHHILHYVVTVACVLQIFNLFALAERNRY